MSKSFFPTELSIPDRRKRKKSKPPFISLPQEIKNKRKEISDSLITQLTPLSLKLASLSDNQRKAVFYKIEHEPGIIKRNSLASGLKVTNQPTLSTTIVHPTEKDLTKLRNKINDFGNGPEIKGNVPNQIFGYVKNIQEISPQDRLSDELRSQYEILTLSERVVCEVELLSTIDARSLKKQKQEIESWLTQLGIKVTVYQHEIVLPVCRVVIGCSGKIFKDLVEKPEWIEKISWFESRPKFQTFQTTLNEFQFSELSPIDSPPETAPTICIIDTGISIGNPFLKPVVRTDALKSFLKSKSNDPSDEYNHGSGVASLASYYALNLSKGAINKPKLWIAGARILNDKNELEDGDLFSKILEEVVEHYVKLGIKVFCLAVGDSSKTWNISASKTSSRTSWTARKIDFLSHKHDVIFITCTGNIPTEEINFFLKDQIEYPRFLLKEESSILDPGQAALSVTVGSISLGTSINAQPNHTPMALQYQPSPFTRSGPGIKKDIKPELVEVGGNLAYDKNLNRAITNSGLEVITASNTLTPPIKRGIGTSYAAPRVAHKLGLIMQDLSLYGITNPSACMLKSFLINSSIHRATELLSKEEHLALTGHGLPDEIRATSCDDYSSILFFDGEIEPDNVLFFEVPIPEDLANSRKKKQITITLSHAPEVQKWGLEQYLSTDIKWRLFRGDATKDEIVELMSEDEDTDSVENSSKTAKEIKFNLGINLRSKGTIQHDTYEWNQHDINFSRNNYILAVASYKKWSRKTQPTKFGLVVRIEDQGREVEINSKISEVLTSIKSRAKTKVRIES